MGAMLAASADLSDEAGFEQSADTVLTWSNGQADILINNAGIVTKLGRLLDVSLADWDRTVASNLRSVFLCTRKFMSALLASSSASIINLSSFLGLVGAYPGFPVVSIPYSASKAGVVGFTRQLAIEYAREHVRVNAIAPGFHGGTNLGRALTRSQEEIVRIEQWIRDTVPMGHRGTPDDLTGLVLYLASDAS